MLCEPEEIVEDESLDGLLNLEECLKAYLWLPLRKMELMLMLKMLVDANLENFGWNTFYKPPKRASSALWGSF